MDTSSRLRYNEVTLPLYDDEGIPDDLSFEADDFCVVFVNIDNFGRMCGANGNPGGSRIYGELINRLCELRPLECDAFKLPRSGFLFVMADRDRELVKEFTQRIVNATKSPFELDGFSLNVSLSIGVAQSGDKTEGDPVDRAQFAASSAARESGSVFEFYDSNEADRITEEVLLKNDLYDALDNGGFFLKYQPVVSLDDYTVCGAEALIRWDHPQRGKISPGAFIPLAEKTGQILFLDRWVVKEAFKQAEFWYEETGKKLPLGINISAWQFRDNHLIDKVEELVDKTTLPPSHIKIEVTETSMMKDVDRTAAVLRELGDLGVQIALDDFGTGHATFEYLSQFPIDELKIDRSFLDFDDVYQKNQKLVDMMIETGERVGTNILAEGVETERQLKFVKNRGCQSAQGFLFEKPILPEKFLELVREQRTLFES
jgi:EAL domain-containing protein (putative c-di-GMP-specific phosphodiesterase class I)/GGDEF domain-containing protein